MGRPPEDVDWKRLYLQLKETYDELSIDWAVLEAEFRDLSDECFRLHRRLALMERHGRSDVVRASGPNAARE